MKYYSNIEDAYLSDLLRKAIIKNDNQSMVFSDSICKDCPYTVRSTEAYIVFYKGVPIDHFTHVTGTVDK